MSRIDPEIVAVAKRMLVLFKQEGWCWVRNPGKSIATFHPSESDLSFNVYNAVRRMSEDVSIESLESGHILVVRDRDVPSQFTVYLDCGTVSA